MPAGRPCAKRWRSRPPAHLAAQAKQHRIGHRGRLLVRLLAVAMACAALGAVVAVFVRPPAVAGESVTPDYVGTRSGADASASSVEQIIARVLPSVVTLQSNSGAEFNK